MTLFLRLALRNVFRNRVRTVLALLAIASGCAALIVNGGVIYDIFAELREDAIRSRHGHLQVNRAGYAEGHLGDPARYLIPPEEARTIVDRIGALERVEVVTRRRRFSGMLASGDRYVSYVGIGVEPEHDTALSRHVTLRAGEPLERDAPYDFLAGLGLAQRFDGEPGTVVTLLTNTETGALNAVDARLRGVFESGMKAWDDWTLKLPLQAAEQLLLDDRTETIVVLLDATEAVDEVHAALVELIEREGLDLEVRTWRELALFHNQTVSLFRRELDVIEVIIATIVILGIANTIGMSILERRVELATLRALGLRPRAVRALLLAEAAITGLVGALLGLALGAVAAAIISAIGIPFPSPPGSTRPFLGAVDFVPGVAASAMLLSLGSTLAAALLPVWRATRRPIAEALRGD